MTDKLYCPRAIESGGGPDSPFKPPFNGEMTWREDQTCSHCGSLHPDALMAALEAGTVELTPTDKSYKVYVDGMPNPRAGLPRIVGCSNSKEQPGAGYVRFVEAEHGAIARDSGWRGIRPGEWVLVDIEGPKRHDKFYFQHLSEAQRKRFIELHNERRLRIAGGGFYVLPFFCKRG